MSAVLNGVYINGEWREGNQVLEVINPATEALLTTVNGGDESAVDLAVSAATAAFKRWSKTSGAERGAILRERVVADCRHLRSRVTGPESAARRGPVE